MGVENSTVRKMVKRIMEDLIKPSNIPGTMTYWHGGNLDGTIQDVEHKKGRFEYGPGLYLTSQWSIAKNYAKGSKKLYLVTVREGVDMDDVSIPEREVMDFLKTHTSRAMFGVISKDLQERMKPNGINANILNNIILNAGALKPSQMATLRKFYIDQGIDYLVTSMAQKSGTMLVLFNMKKIVDIKRVMPNDEIEKFDL
jgi:hypothetical protein